MKRKAAQPRIKIEPEPIDWAIELIGVIAIILLFTMPIYYFDRLPGLIPSHFAFDGTPDGYSGKITIWILPAIGIIMYAGMNILNRFPHIFNYLVKITEENARRQYKLATRFIRILNTIIAALFCYMTFVTIQTAIGNQDGLGEFSIIFCLILIFGSIGIYFYKSIKMK